MGVLFIDGLRFMYLIFKCFVRTVWFPLLYLFGEEDGAYVTEENKLTIVILVTVVTHVFSIQSVSETNSYFEILLYNVKPWVCPVYL